MMSADWVPIGQAWLDEGLCRHLDHTALDAEGPAAHSFSCRSFESKQATRYKSKGDLYMHDKDNSVFHMGRMARFTFLQDNSIRSCKLPSTLMPDGTILHPHRYCHRVRRVLGDDVQGRCSMLVYRLVIKHIHEHRPLKDCLAF